MTHKNLFINKAIDFLVTNKDGLYIDCTFGLGGHSKQILNRLSKNGRLISIDNDLNSKKIVKKLGISLDKRFIFINTNFSCLEVIAKKQNFFGKVSGIILDLGISTYQIKDYKRGFSFFINGPLDMRINNTLGLTACDFLNKYQSKQILKIFKTYGDDGFLYRLTQKICNRRNQFPFKMTLELSNLIKQIYFKKYHHIKQKHKQKQITFNITLKHKLTNIKTNNKLIKLTNTKYQKQITINHNTLINNNDTNIKTLNTTKLFKNITTKSTTNNNTKNKRNTKEQYYTKTKLYKQKNTTNNKLYKYKQLFKTNNTNHTATNKIHNNKLQHKIKQNTIHKTNNKPIHPATKIFQSIRSYINNELQNLEFVIVTSLKILKKNTTLIIITFNSLESQLVKQVLKTSFAKIIKLYPSFEEVIYNKSSRSSTMFVIKKI